MLNLRLRHFPPHGLPAPRWIVSRSFWLAAAQQRNLFEPDAPEAVALPWEEAAAADLLAAQVVFNRPLETVYQYLVPDRLRPNIASRASG